ncbi:MAG: NAD-dependent epimerase/dehydratase family protein [Lentisphaeria bacterium]|jgi:nucleoside-diphosphate-sugar epimerase|nr:NAD-dependent epimerase/dehydratase family protein [Lentisphaeria bacterium]
MMKAIIFGGTGWLGHNIALDLIQHGYEVSVCSRGQKNTYRDTQPQCRSLQADKNDAAAMSALLQEPYDVIIDTVPSLDSMALVKKFARGLKHYLHCSSTGGYAPLPYLPCDENAPYRGFEGGSGWKIKADIDAEALRLFQLEGFPATVIRPCYITGIGMLPLDNLGGRRKDFIADIIAEKPLDLPDNGLALLQPIHVKDLARSFRLAIENRRSIGQVYNICLEHAFTLNRYLQITAAVFGKTAHINYVPLAEMLQKYPQANQTGMRFLASHMCFSIAKAERDLGYKPKYSSEAAIEETAVWAAKQSGH